jgi:hypothetical protein
MFMGGVESINKVGVDCQIADKWMAVGECKDFLFALLADQAAKIFEAVGAGFERLGAGAVDGSCRVLFYQSAQAHNGSQRFGSAQLEGALSPLSGWFAYDRGPADPVTARTDDWSV